MNCKSRFQEKKEHAQQLFINNFELIGKLKGQEVIVNSKAPKTSNEVEADIDHGNSTRKNIRDARLERYERMAEADQKFQNEMLKVVQVMQDSMNEIRESRNQTIILFARLVDAIEKQQQQQQQQQQHSIY